MINNKTFIKSNIPVWQKYIFYKGINMSDVPFLQKDEKGTAVTLRLVRIIPIFPIKC